MRHSESEVWASPRECLGWARSEAPGNDCFLLLEFLEFRKRSREEFDSLEAVDDVRLPDGPCEDNDKYVKNEQNTTPHNAETSTGQNVKPY